MVDPASDPAILPVTLPAIIYGDLLALRFRQGFTCIKVASRRPTNSRARPVVLGTIEPTVRTFWLFGPLKYCHAQYSETK